jgi:hypothetical protein
LKLGIVDGYTPYWLHKATHPNPNQSDFPPIALLIHQKTLAAANDLTNVSLKRALLCLSSWGMELFRSAVKDSSDMEMTLAVDGKCVFRDNNNHGQVLVALEPNATKCRCSFWKAYQIQCPHLFLLHRGFCLHLCCPRWHQSSGLGTSVGDDQYDFGLFADQDELELSVASNTAKDGSDISVGCENPPVKIASNGGTDLRFGDILNLAYDLAQSVANVSSHTKKNQFFGEMIKLTEMVKGNLEAVHGMSVENLLNCQLHMYSRSSTGKQRFPQKATPTQSSTSDGEELTVSDLDGYRHSMKRACPTPANNHAKGRKKSKEEKRNNSYRRVMQSNQRQNPRCSLCGSEGHRAIGARCQVVVDFKAPLIQWREIEDMAKRLGDPEYYEVKQPDDETRQRIIQWFSGCGSGAMPTDACHLVLLNTYFGEMANLHCNNNLIEVAVLEERGTTLLGFEKAFFPAHRIREWLEKNCASHGRTKHCLSALRKIVDTAAAVTGQYV